MTPDDIATRIRGHPATVGLRLLVLHGSRARGEARPDSDWDLGVLTSGATDLAALATVLSRALGTDAVDLVDLDRASALLRYRAARDGVAVVEGTPGDFMRFRLDAVGFWCDVGPVVRAAQDDVLAALG